MLGDAQNKTETKMFLFLAQQPMRRDTIAADAAYAPEPDPETAAAPIGQCRADGLRLPQPAASGKASVGADRGGFVQPRRAPWA